MKILYIGNFKEFHRTEHYIKWALESLGHKVIQANVVEINTPGKVEAKSVGVKFVLFGKVRADNTLRLIQRFKAKKLLTVCWQHDLYKIPSRLSFPQEFNCDLVFSTDGTIDLPKHQVLRQGVHSPEATLTSKKLTIPVAFVGHSNNKFQPGRGELVKWLKKTYKHNFLHITNTRGMDLNYLLQASSVVVGDSYPRDNYWSNRIYEVLGRGGFLLHPETVGLGEEFEDGVHYKSYERGNFDQLRSLITQFSADHQRREEIRLAGHLHTKKNFTYTKRCEVLLDVVRDYLS